MYDGDDAKKSLLNPFISALINENSGIIYRDVANDVYEYTPDIDCNNNFIITEEERLFLKFIKEQLKVSSNKITCYYAGKNILEITESATLRKLKNYFKRMFILSLPGEILSQYLIITDLEL